MNKQELHNTDKITYSGVVNIKSVHGEHRFHNNGTEKLFKFLRDVMLSREFNYQAWRNLN